MERRVERIDLRMDLRGVEGQNGEMSELGDNILNVLREEYFKKGYKTTDSDKLKYIQGVLGVEDSERTAILGENQERLHDTYLGVNYIDILKPSAKSEYYNWLRTTRAGLGHKSPMELILSGNLTTVMGFIYPAIDGEYRG